MDEVIEALECCELGSMYNMCESCPYAGIDNCNVEIQKDALHYLKKYREEYKILIKTINEAIDVEMKYYHMIEELEHNSPLTWDELRQMEGKPVWVEFSYEDGQHFDSDWFLVDFVSESFCDVIGKLGTSRLVKNDYWQAYRRENENTR